jgi:hypothetical protein
MTTLRWIIIAQFTTIFALGQLVQPSRPPGVPAKPEAVVRSLYHVVVARHPIGLPTGADRKALAPYLSEGLLRELDTAQVCAGDYSRQHPRDDEKPEFEWLELGLFSGGNERASPSAFHIESAQPVPDGSFRVHARLTYKEPAGKSAPPYNAAETFSWYVDVIVARDNGRLVVADVVFPKDEWDDESRLTQALTAGCDGPRWVGYGDPK